MSEKEMRRGGQPPLMEGNLMKRFLSLVLAILLAVSMLLMTANADTTQTGVVKGGWLRLRAEASFSATTLASYFTGTQVTVLGKSGDWYYVQTQDGYYGYMYKSYLTVSGSGSSTTGTTMYVYAANGKPVRMRSGPSTNYSILTTYSVGTQVTMLGMSGDWYYVLKNGTYGYIYKSYLSMTKSGGTTPSTGTTMYVYAANGKPVRMRSGPSTDYSVLGSYNVGTQVTVLLKGADWSKVTIGSVTGYMMTQYLSTSKSSVTPSTSYTAYVYASNGKPVRMRAGAGTNYTVLSTYNVGTQVTVLEYGKTWCKIYVNGSTGYMMTAYLTTTAPTVISSVSISKSIAWAGETLTAVVYPSTKNVSYEWLNEAGTRLGTGSSYTVRTSDAGHQIRVRATGTNGTSGTVVSSWAAIQGDGSSSATYQLKLISLNTTSVTVGTTLTATLSPAGATANIYWYLENGTYLGFGSTYTVQETAVGRRIFAYAEGTNSTTGTVTSSYTEPVTSGATPSYTLTGVTLSNYAPTVGTTITASISPSGATANLLWYRDDNEFMGSGDTYVITSSDVGHSVYVWAQGTGVTTGTATSAYTQIVPSEQKFLIDSVSLNDLNPTVGETLVATVSPSGATALITWYRDDDKILTYGTTYTVQAEDAGHTLYVWAEGTGNTSGSATSRITSAVQAN